MLTINEKKVYRYIVEYIDENLYPPTLEEICEATKLKSKSSASYILKSLKDKGYINLKSNSPRAIALVGYRLTKSDKVNV